MTFSPFGQTVKLWRLHRGYTQAELSRRSRVPRPNLSVIEQGKREVSLSTLRSLAFGLDVRPGILADGWPPPVPSPRVWSRGALERIADAVVEGRAASRRSERAVAQRLQAVLRHRIQLTARRRGAPRRGIRRGEAAWLSLRARCSPEILRSLLKRIDDRQRSQGSSLA